jgi:hypothetical protein
MNAAEQVLMVGINTTSTTLLSSLLNNTLSQRVTKWVEAHNHVLSPPNRAKLPHITVVVRETAAGERKIRKVGEELSMILRRSLYFPNHRKSARCLNIEIKRDMQQLHARGLEQKTNSRVFMSTYLSCVLEVV